VTAAAAFAQAACALNCPEVSPTAIYYYVAAIVFGAIVGGGEIVSRYRTDPWRALTTTTSFAYVAINALASLGALYIVRRMNWLIDAEATADHNLLMQTLAASFGAIAIFRSSLFTLRVGSSDVAVGPMAMLQAFLAAADRATDRTCAQPRADSVTRIMAGISFERAKVALPTLCFTLMQNVSLEEQHAVAADVERFNAAAMEDADKAHNLGLTLLSVVGEEVLQRAVDLLRRSIRLVRKSPDLALVQLTKNLSFKTHADDLVNLLLLMTGQQANAQNLLVAELKRIDKVNIGDTDKLLVLLGFLLAEFGEESVRSALGSIAAAATPPTP